MVATGEVHLLRGFRPLAHQRLLAALLLSSCSAFLLNLAMCAPRRAAHRQS